LTTLHVEQDSDTGAWFETTAFGRRIPQELWDRYEEAERVLATISEAIDQCPYDAQPAPEPGTPFYGLYKMLVDYELASLGATARSAFLQRHREAAK
jgi:hypothetical protein